MFTYDPALVARYPSLRAGVLEVSDAPNGPSPDALVAAFAAEQQAAMAQLAGVALADLASIAAWRRVFTSFGVSPTKYRNAAEALLRRVQKKGDVPSVGLLVDLGNLVSIRHRLPIAVIDADRVAGGVTVRMARGDEHFDDLGGTEAAHPVAGEVVFVDDADEVVARRWCWRQSARSGVSATTRRLLIAVEAHHDTGAGDVLAALDSFGELFDAFVPTATLSSRTLP